MLETKGSKAVIIGGTHGIGLTTASQLLSKGVNVLITGRNPTNLQSAKDQLGGQTIVQACDITSLQAITTLSQIVKDKFGTIGLLFINAGYASLEPFTAVTKDSFERTMNTNLFGAFFSAQSLAPLVNPGGSIVFTTSVANKHGIPGMSIYAASKAAVHSLVQTLAAELAPKNIRVNAVSPGFIKTPTMGVVDATKGELEAFEKLGVMQTPLGRIGSEEEVARTVIYLGYEATFTTGSEVVVDGGLAGCKGGEH